MSQSITLHIAGKDYPLIAPSPEMERRMRLAAEEINTMLSMYDTRFPDKPLLDKLAFVTLNETVAKFALLDKSEEVSAETSGLENELSSYLSKIERNR